MIGVRGRGINILSIIVLFMMSYPVWAQEQAKPKNTDTVKKATDKGQTNQKQQSSQGIETQTTDSTATTNDASTTQNPNTVKTEDVNTPKVTNPPVVKGREQHVSKPAQQPTTELQLRQLATLVEDLKNRVTAINYKLNLMKEVITEEQSTIGGSKLVIKHINKMGGSFKLVRLRYFLNGQLLQSYNAANSKDESILSKSTIKIPVGLVSPGPVKVKVFITYRGNGYGIFRYVNKWTWEISGEVTVDITAGKYYEIQVIGYEKGNFNTPLKDKPAIKFKTRVMPLIKQKGSNAKKAKKAK